MFSVQDVLLRVIEDMRMAENTMEAPSMAAYMKHHFPFLGLKKEKRTQLSKPLLDLKPSLWRQHELKEIILQLWQLPEREFQYVAVDLLKKHQNRLQKLDIEWIEDLITHKSWWDTVDLLSSNTIGSLLQTHPSIISQRENWLHSENMWLNRTAIIYQLRYKSKTDIAFLKEAIETHLPRKEFFIAKAIGWALREYAKTNSSWVIQFVNSHEGLQHLSKREALKHL